MPSPLSNNVEYTGICVFNRKTGKCRSREDDSKQNCYYIRRSTENGQVVYQEQVQYPSLSLYIGITGNHR